MARGQGVLQLAYRRRVARVEMVYSTKFEGVNWPGRFYAYRIQGIFTFVLSQNKASLGTSEFMLYLG